MTSEIVEAEVVEVNGTDVVETHQDQSVTLFRTDDPVQVLERATQTADALKDVIEQRGLFTNISGKAHVRVEGWQTLGSMLGVTPVCVWTRQLDNGWEARVEARTLDGRTVGAAEAMCTRSERMWAKRDDYALRSMAQTRATSKALASPLRFVITLAGYEGTPAEEMTFAEEPSPALKEADEPFTFDRLKDAAAKAGLNKEQMGRIGEFIGVLPGDLTGINPRRLRQCIERIEAGDAKGLSTLIGRADQ